MSIGEAEISEAISAAKEIFWRHGYEDASIEEVVKATGLNRYKLYNAFGSKLEIFLAALETYFVERKNIFLKTLSDPSHAPIDAIKLFFEFTVSEMAVRRTGCLMCDVAVEAGRRNRIVSGRVASYLEEIKSSYAKALRRGEARGELNPVVTPQEGAALLIAIMLGLGAHAKNGASKQEMLKIVNTAISILKRSG